MALTQNLAATVSDQTIGLGYNAASQIATRSSSNDLYAMRQQYNANRGYSVNGLNQYLTAGRAIPTYDARGNLTGQGTSSFTYSSENLLKSATLSSGASTLSYDPAMRLAQTSGSATTRFLYDGTDLVAEYDGAGTVVLRRYVHGPGADEPLVWYEGSGTSDRRWLHADERGSIIAVTNGSGNAIGINAYDEWGNPQSGNLGRFGYTGQTWLPEIGLWYYKARMYNPRLGRFMQTDPIGYGDGMNLYAYVGGDPVNRGDPSGLATIAFESCRTLTGIGTYSADGGAIPDGGAIDGSAIVVTGKKEKCSLEYAYIPDSFYEQPQPRSAPLKNTPPGKGQVQSDPPCQNKSLAVKLAETGLDGLGLLGDGAQVLGAYTGFAPLAAAGTAAEYASVGGSAALHWSIGDRAGLAEDAFSFSAGLVPGGRIARKFGGAALDWGRKSNGRFVKGLNGKREAQNAAYGSAQGTAASAASFCPPKSG